jgi:mRNA interferase RelE/StbE
MIYNVQFKPKSIKDAQTIPKKDLKGIFEKIEFMKTDLRGNVKRLTNFTPEYRLRIGNYRVLFEIEDKEIVIYRILHRKDVYR